MPGIFHDLFRNDFLSQILHSGSPVVDQSLLDLAKDLLPLQSENAAEKVFLVCWSVV